MSVQVFPDLPGLTWTVKVAEDFKTLKQESVAPGFETRVSLGPDPIRHFEMTYNYLREYDPTTLLVTMSNEVRALRGFWRARKGDFETFLLYLPNLTRNDADGVVVGQALTPDASGAAPLVLSDPFDSENIYEAAGVNGNPGVAPVLSMGGVPMSAGTDYTWAGPGYVSTTTVGGSTVSTTYPGLVALVIKAITAPVTADFSWYYRVRFEQGQQQFEKFMALIWRAQTVQLIERRS